MTKEEKKEYMKIYRAVNKKKIAAQAKLYQETHAAEIKAYRSEYVKTERYKEIKSKCDAKYYDKNKDKASQYGKQKYIEKKEVIKKRVKSWSDSNKHKTNIYKKKYRENNPKKVSISNTRWAKSNPDIRRIHYQNRRSRIYSSRLSKGIIEILLLQQNGLCNYCGVDVTEGKYHVDHIIPLSRGGEHSDNNVQLLCKRCNLSKGAKLPEEYFQFNKGLIERALGVL